MTLPTRDQLKLKTYKDLRGFWNVSWSASDHRVVLGKGATEDQAIDSILARLERVEAFLALPRKSQLRKLLDDHEAGRIGSLELERAVRLIAEILLDSGHE